MRKFENFEGIGMKPVRIGSEKEKRNPLPVIGDISEEVSNKVHHIIEEAETFAKNPAHKKDQIGAATRHLKRKLRGITTFLEKQKAAYQKANLSDTLLKHEADAIRKSMIETEAYKKAIEILQSSI